MHLPFGAVSSFKYLPTDVLSKISLLFSLASLYSNEVKFCFRHSSLIFFLFFFFN